ncbi:MAG: L,D-transpeptidase [Bacteroidota bacterium]|nr:L,D-transpeptidase [Bacteroidota bacterium]
MTDFNLQDSSQSLIQSRRHHYLYSIGLPIIIVVLVLFGFTHVSFKKSSLHKIFNQEETKGGQIKNAGKLNILSSEDLSVGIRDTVYTDKECWLELRIDQQTLYQHWRNGTLEKYPISSGNNKGSDPEALESRPGLFAIFVKEEHHISSQFDAANMYHFMPFNQGIGFHSIDGTGYYGHLGVRPSSHGCIRMKHEDAKKLFKDCEKGTLVLASNGVSARAVAFAPNGFENEKEFSKDEYKKMMATNLFNLINKRYYLEEREKFVVDPKVIPVSGVYIGYDVEIPKKQIVPRSYVTFSVKKDRIFVDTKQEILEDGISEEFVKLISNGSENRIDKFNKNPVIKSPEDLIKQYFHNPIGILPYFGPKK